MPSVWEQASRELAGIVAEATEELIAEQVDVIEILDNPEKLLGKKYELWSPQDLQWLTMVYGNSPDSKLNKFIADKEYAKVLELEQSL